MRLLSEVTDWLLCPAAKANAMDPVLSMGCHWNGGSPPEATAGEHAAIQSQVAALNANKDFRKPLLITGSRKLKNGEEVFNDLYIPGYKTDADGLLHIDFPVPIGTPLSSTFLGRDWRFAALAHWVEQGLADIKGVIVTAWDASGRRVADRLDPNWLNAFGTIEFPGQAHERPGPVCTRCSRNGNCVGLESFLESHSLGTPDGDPRERQFRQQKLFVERMDLATKLEVLKSRQEQVDKELRKSCSDGNMNIGSEVIKLEGHRIKKWDYQKVKSILIGRGYWLDKYGAVSPGALQEDMTGFPREVQAALATACTETITEPSITEAISHGRQAVARPSFQGFS